MEKKSGQAAVFVAVGAFLLAMAFIGGVLMKGRVEEWWSGKVKHDAPTVPYSVFVKDVNEGVLAVVTISGMEISAYPSGRNPYRTYGPIDRGQIEKLAKDNVIVHFSGPSGETSASAGSSSGGGGWSSFNIFIALVFSLMVVFAFLSYRAQRQGPGGGAKGAFGFGKSRARLQEEKDNKITFADVAGCDEAKAEVAEVVSFLKDPSDFAAVGAKIPKGVLMIGPSGTGKTLLARAIAGEAKVPFFSISGSDFVEMFVGVGAARVRDMFEEAKKKMPCIVFIDEIDAVGKKRSAGVVSNDEREQTLNQLLVEMDGFIQDSNIVVVAATNRVDVLDPALLRPGRFDRQVVVPLPDVNGRERILLVHMKKVPVEGVKEEIAREIARGTPQFSGAELANLVNEAALCATRDNKRKVVTMDDFERAKDRVVMGAERLSMVLLEDERRVTAYHEAGHAIVAKLLPQSDPVNKISIIPRGQALGVTMQLPERDRYSQSKEYLESRIAILFGGRVAEELFIGEVTTGAASDFFRANEIARKMATEWGMAENEALKLLVIKSGDGDFGSFIARNSVSEETLAAIDSDVAKRLHRGYETARTLLVAHRETVRALAEELLAKGTLGAKAIDKIMGGTQTPQE